MAKDDAKRKVQGGGMPLGEWIDFLFQIGLSKRIVHEYEIKLYQQEACKMGGREEISCTKGRSDSSTEEVSGPIERSKLNLSDPSFLGSLSLCSSFLSFAEQTRLVVTSKPLKHVIQSDDLFWRDLCFPAGNYDFELPILNNYIQLSKRKVTSLRLGWVEDPRSAKIDDYSLCSNSSSLRISVQSFRNIEEDGRLFRSLCEQRYFENLRTLYLAQDFQWISHSTLYMLLAQAAPKLEDLFVTLPAWFDVSAIEGLINKMISLKSLEVRINTGGDGEGGGAFPRFSRVFF